MATIARHKEISDTLLEHAEVEFEKGDLIQASEKTWGALAHCVKSIAKARGWRNRSHRDIRRNAQRLIDGSSDPVQYWRMFKVVEWLHINFYEEIFSKEEVRQGIDDARELIEAIETAEARIP